MDGEDLSFIMVALRALGVDTGPMSRFVKAAVQAAYFSGSSFEVNFICNFGYGAAVDLMPRPPRLELEEIVHRPATNP